MRGRIDCSLPCNQQQRTIGRNHQIKFSFVHGVMIPSVQKVPIIVAKNFAYLNGAFLRCGSLVANANHTLSVFCFAFEGIHVHKNYDVDIEFNISFAEFQNFKSKSTFVGEEYMTEAHKMGNYSELRSSEPWTPDRLLAN